MKNRCTKWVCLLGLGLVLQPGLARASSVLDPWPWQAQFHPKVKAHTEFDLKGVGDQAVLTTTADKAYGSWVDAFKAPRVLREFSWRWSVLKHPEGANLKKKEGDDAAAKVCLFVHIDESRLSIGSRMALGAARMVSSEPLPAATLCYVWASSNAVQNDVFPNPFTSLVFNWVLENGPASDQWLPEKRDVQADAKRVFGDLLPDDPVKFDGVALGSDSDNTGSQAKARFAAFSAQ